MQVGLKIWWRLDKFLAYKTGGHGVDERVPINHIRKNMEIYTLALIKLLEL